MATAARLKRKRKHDLRQMINIILWLLPTGCQWRNLPEEWPNWQAVYYYYEQWKQDGTFEPVNLALNQLDRKRIDKEAYPSVLYIDSQSVKLNPMICEYRGTKANKRGNAGPPVRYNRLRRHSALGYFSPFDYYKGQLQHVA